LSHAPSPFCFNNFWNGVCTYAWASLAHDSPYAFCLGAMTGTCRRAWLLLVEMKVSHILVWADLESQSSLTLSICVTTPRQDPELSKRNENISLQ
jgi:hypothetical protein